MSTKDLIHKKENKYFIFAVIISIFFSIILILSITGILFFVFFTVLSFFAHAMSMAYIRSNGVRLSPQQFPQVFCKIQELCEKIEMPRMPDVYVLESGGLLNAFATRFFGRNMVVLYSDVFSLINSDGDEELTFVIAHELAHIKRNHITKRLLVLPAMWIPFLGEAYSRVCEYTCDRMAAYYTGNADAAMKGLTLLAIGKSLYRQVDRADYLYQASQERGMFIWLVEKLSTHPPLPKRIHEIEAFNGIANQPVSSKTSRLAWVFAVTACLAITGSFLYSFITSDNFGNIKATFQELQAALTQEEGSSPLIRAAAEGNLKEIKEQLEKGADPNVQDVDGWSPLMWAAQDNNVQLIRLLMDNNADPTLRDYEEQSALEMPLAQVTLKPWSNLLNWE